MSNEDFIPGFVGAFVEDLPLLTTAHVKPYVIAILLHRGAVKHGEVVAALIPHCSSDEIKVGAWDPLDGDYCEGTRVEKLVDEVLGEFVSQGDLRYNEELDLWVLTSKNLPRIIAWASALGAKIPPHFVSEIASQGDKIHHSWLKKVT